jgi:hypothetical protein
MQGHQCWGRGLERVSSAPQLKVLPLSLVAEAAESMQNWRDIPALEDQWLTVINEGEANSPAPGQLARYFHEREESRKIARASKFQVNWPVTEARSQDFGPCRSVKNS